MKKGGAAAPRPKTTASRTAAGGTKKKPAAKKKAAGKKPAATPEVAPSPAPVDGEVSPKSRTVALLLYLFLGYFSVHRFYVGKIGTAIVQILTMGGFGIWWTIDFIMILCGAFKDKQKLPLKKW
ncbi:MAG: TM2 domain-containing protein [Verrucomicrobia bacterium]|nr:TM2 domain-containing protein [Verrucomicrobiota bacterium]